MWQTYRERFIPSQLFIAAMAVVLHFTVARRHLLNTVALIAFMEIFAVLGAFWGHRLKKRLERRG